MDWIIIGLLIGFWIYFYRQKVRQRKWENSPPGTPRPPFYSPRS